MIMLFAADTLEENFFTVCFIVAIIIIKNPHIRAL